MMRHNKKRVVKVCEELTMFFFSVGADSISSKIEFENDDYKIYFSSNYAPEYKTRLESLNKYLNCDSEAGAEEEYWALAGASEMDEGSELMLIGMMVSYAHISITPCSVNLVLRINSHK